MIWDHMTLPSIGNSLFQLQISSLGTTIGPRNLSFRPPVSQETFWILESCFRILESCFRILDLALWIVNSQLWIMNYDWWLWLMIMIDDYGLWLWLMIMNYDWWLWLWLWSPNTLRLVVAKPPAGSFRKKHLFSFWNFLQNTETAKTVFFCDFCVPLIFVFH